MRAVTLDSESSLRGLIMYSSNEFYIVTNCILIDVVVFFKNLVK